MPKTRRSAVSIAINNTDGAILLVHKPRGYDAWQLPQGGIEKGETTEEAAQRELKEETGIDIDGAAFRRCPQTYEYDYPEDFKQREHPDHDGQRLTFVAATVPADTVVNVDRKELDDFAWVQPEELGTYIRRKDYREVVQRVVEEYRNIGVPEYRITGTRHPDTLIL